MPGKSRRRNGRVASPTDGAAGFPQGPKPRLFVGVWMYGLKLVPFRG